MTNQELNEFIKNYIEHDKTRSAIMLTAPWGTGKSYYIKNELVPYLGKEENGNHKCVVVSLYGITKTIDISKAIFLETKMKFLTNPREKAATGMFTAKTVLKGVTSFFGIDLSKSEDEMKELYESIDLSGKLIILEDIERTGVDIIELLGYVNNLVEQDGVKVMLVSNENELIQYEPIVEEDKEKQETAELLDRLNDHEGRRFTLSTQRYLQTKEKTVSDTILFEGNHVSAVDNILSSYNNGYFDLFAQIEEHRKLLSLLRDFDIVNLRTFIFACQKTDDILTKIKPDATADSDFIKTIFYSIIVFSNRIKGGNKLLWKEGGVFSTSLSSEDYPLFRFCYEYITRQTFDTEMIEPAKEALRTLRRYDKSKSIGDKDLQVLYSWWVYPEKDIAEAVLSVTDRLQNEDDISFYEYGRIALYIVAIKHIIGCDIEAAKKHLVENLHNKGDIVHGEYLFTVVLGEDESPEVIEEYSDLKAAMIDSLDAKETTIFDFDYKPSSISEFYGNIVQKEGKILTGGAFAARLDPDKVTEMLKCSSAMEIHEFRGAFLSVYRAGNIREFLSVDKDNIGKLLDRVKDLEIYDGFDRIQRMQIQFFVKNLTMIFNKL